MAVDRLLEHAMTQIAQVDPGVVADTLEDMLVVDVREPWEVLHGYLPGAVNVPRGLIEFRAENDESFRLADRKILLYSTNGRRSALAALALQELGFRNVVSLAGGIQRWFREKFPVN